MPALQPLQSLGFLLAGYAVLGNDALQTLGPFLAGNRGRVPRPWQALFLCTVLCAVLLLGWRTGQGDPAWGRLAAVGLPEPFGWPDLLPALAVLGLTRWGLPVSTSFLLLTAFAPASLGGMVLRSLAGYGLAFLLGLMVYGALAWLLERPAAGAVPTTAVSGSGEGGAGAWLALQWLATGWLWSQWLIQDLANVYVYLPRRLPATTMVLSLTALCLGVGLLVALGGGPIQALLSSKRNGGEPRSTTLIALLFGLILFGLARLIHTPLSTTWVFLGLLGGREAALTWRLGAAGGNEGAADSSPEETSGAGLLRTLTGDLLKAGAGLVISVAVALLVPLLKARI
jgi:hypothetical protein